MFDLGNIIESYLLILIIIFFSLLILIFIFISIILTQRPKTTYSSTPLRKFFRGEKIDHEKWVIVCGPVGSGKSNLLDEIKKQLLVGETGESLILHHAKDESDGEHKILEVSVKKTSTQNGSSRLLFWETNSLNQKHRLLKKSFTQVDEIIMIIDVTKLPSIKESLPSHLSNQSYSSQEIFEDIQLIENIAKELKGDYPKLRLVLKKVDLLRYSINQEIREHFNRNEHWQQSLNRICVEEPSSLLNSLDLLGIERRVSDWNKSKSITHTHWQSKNSKYPSANIANLVHTLIHGG